jgi:uncharacterized membrane protein
MKVRYAIVGVLVTGVVLLVFDIVWLSAVAVTVYDRALVGLKRDAPYVPAAALFYGMYTVATFVYAVHGASTWREAVRRGAGLGLVAYSTYELTNWAVLRGWPAHLVLVDTVWGVFLTASAAAISHLLLGRIFRAR